MNDEHEKAITDAAGAIHDERVKPMREGSQALAEAAISAYLTTMRESGYHMVELDREEIARAIEDVWALQFESDAQELECYADAIITMLKGGEDE